jgi:dolichol-phosphate mannosyltransferase
MSIIEPEISVVVPVRDEEENVDSLIGEIEAALAGKHYEIVYVDDGSRDGTAARLAAARARSRGLRVLRHRHGAGQSAGLVTGVRAARGTWIATLDGDGQNDPADIPKLLARAQSSDAPALVAGHRVARRDTLGKRVSSRIANAIRGALLGDRTPDTGCGLKVFRRATFLALPPFNHMHRFLPALVIRDGGTVVNVPVTHRPRRAGRSKYGLLNRLFVGMVDLLGVMWLIRRPVRVECENREE